MNGSAGGLWELVAGVRADGKSPDSVAIVGMAKNAGKTVVLNYLVRRATAAGVKVGLLSVGRDGEAVDVFTSRPKPRIWAPPGAVVATAPRPRAAGVGWAKGGSALDNAGGLAAGLETPAVLDERTVRPTGIETALGEVVVASVARAGRVELIGPARLDEARRLAELLRAEGAEFVFIDGAIDRMASAAVTPGQAVVLATGAVLSRDVAEVARRTAFRVKLFLLPRVSLPLALEEFEAGDDTVQAVVQAAELGINGVVAVGQALTEADAEKAAGAAEGAEFLAVAGAVTDRLLVALGRRRFRGTLVARDATRLVAGQSAVEFFESRGGRLAVLEPVRLLAVTVNSHNPTGPGIEAETLLGAVAGAVRPVPVFDVVHGRKGQ